MTELLRWGIIGPGRIAEKFAKDLTVVPDAKLYAVASQSGSRQLADSFRVPSFYDNYQALAADPAVAAIYIATPHNSHYQNARLCLEAGKPVMVEKPLTVNAAQAEELVSLAQAKGVFLMEALWTRFLPAFRRVRGWLEAEEIGEVLMMRSSFNARMAFDAGGRHYDPDLAGGSLLDLGIYSLAVSQSVMQANPTSIQAQAVVGSTGVDECLAVNLQYASGAISQFSTMFRGHSANGMEVFGTRGKISIESWFFKAESAHLERYGRQPERFRGKFRRGGFEYQIEEAGRRIRAGEIESPLMSHTDSLANLRVMDEIRRQIGVRYPFE